jgi:uncharacterized membrane protein YwaF
LRNDKLRVHRHAADRMQAIITPDTRFAFPHFEYVQTCVHHGLLKVAVITNAYLVVIFFFNLLVQVFGPWPWYVLGMELVGAISCCLVFSPVALENALKRRRALRAAARAA